MHLMQRVLRTALVWVVSAPAIAAAPISVAAAQETPRLEIDSPFAGTPLSLDGDASGNYLVTTSSARTLTIWTRTGDKSWQPAIIHAPHRDDYASASYLGAITPNGKYIAFSAPPLSNGKGSYQPKTAQIYILDRTDQHLVATLSTGIPTKIMRLRFSPDGQYLGAILSNGCGYRIWTSEQWSNVTDGLAPKWSDDQAYADNAGTTQCFDDASSGNPDSLPSGSDIVFTGNSGSDAPWLLTLSDNGFRSYAKNGNEISQTGYVSSKALAVDRPHTLAFSTDTDDIAIGDYQAPKLAVLHRNGAKYDFVRNLTIPDGQLSKVGKDSVKSKEIFLPNPVWVKKQNRTFLYAFGYFQPSNLIAGNPHDDANSIVVFDSQSGKATLIRLVDDSDSSLGVLRRNNNIFFVSTRRLSVLDARSGIDAAARVTPIAGSHALDLRGRLPRFGLPLSKKDKVFALLTTTGDNKYLDLQFDFGAMSFRGDKNLDKATDLEKSAKGYQQSTEYYDTVAHPKEWGFERLVVDQPPPSFFGHPISPNGLDRNETAYSGVEVPGGKQAVWGSDRTLRMVNSEGGFDCVRPIESTAWRMNITNDGRMVLVAHGDGVMRWYRLEPNGDKCLSLVASLYITRQDNGSWGFLAWLPGGKFMTGGGAGIKRIACYPTPRPDGLTSCVDFQKTDALYDPEAVRRALREASSDEGGPVDAQVEKSLAETPADRQISVSLKGSSSAPVPDYDLTATVKGWTEGKRYLQFRSGAVDVPFTYDGILYSASKPLPLSGPGDFAVKLSLPDVLHHKGKPIEVCPSIYLTTLSDGRIDPSHAETLTKDSYCLNPTWTGQDTAKPTKEKLWALLVGFSGSAHMATPPLRYAHKDALNLARLLELISKHNLPPNAGGKTAQSFFDEMRIRLLIADPDPPKDDKTKEWVAKIQSELDGDKFIVISPQQPDDTYDKLVKDAITDTFADISRFNDDHRDDNFNWEHRIVVYFSGHGFSRKDKDPNGKPYVRMGLVTPNTKDDLVHGSVWLDDVLRMLVSSQYMSVVIIDACRALPDAGGSQPIDDQLASIALYPNIGINTQQNLYILYSSTAGHYSYEDAADGIANFVPQFSLWPPELETTGGGFFSMGLLASLVCQEALLYDRDFTLKNSDVFFHQYFFNEDRNPAVKALQAKLDPELKQLNLSFLQPATAYDGWGSMPPVLRPRSDKMPKCFK
jgi:hypothetical protein